jgi:hypothetical protein
MVDTCFEGHTTHLYTLFEENPSGMDGCSSASLDVVHFDGSLPFWDNPMKVCSFNGFWLFFGEPKL